MWIEPYRLVRAGQRHRWREKTTYRITQPCDSISLRPRWACAHRHLRCGPCGRLMWFCPQVFPVCDWLWDYRWLHGYFSGNLDNLWFSPQGDLICKSLVFGHLIGAPQCLPWAGKTTVHSSLSSVLLSHQRLHYLMPNNSRWTWWAMAFFESVTSTHIFLKNHWGTPWKLKCIFVWRRQVDFLMGSKTDPGLISKSFTTW